MWSAPHVLQPLGRTQPDLDLIKQVEQVTTSVWPTLARHPKDRDQSGGRGSGMFNSQSGFADISLQKTAKTARSGRGRPVCERAVRHAAGPHPAVPLLTRFSAKFGEIDRGNLACCPNFKVSHYLLGDFVVAPVPDALASLIVRRGDATRAPLRRPLRVTVIVRGDS